MTLWRWWSRRALRTRLVVGSVLPLAFAVIVGAVAVAAVFAAGRLREVDTQLSVESDTLRQLTATGQVSRPLPVPAGSTLLAQVLDSDGAVLAASPAASDVLPLEPVPVRSGRRTQERPTYGDVPLRLDSRPALLAGRPVTVVVAAPLGDVRRAIHALRVVLVVVTPLLVLAATLLARFLVGSALRPVERLRAAAEQMAADPAGAGVLPVGPQQDELHRLADTLNEVLGRMRELVRGQASFVADAAHELRSPLASMQVQLDVARLHPDSRQVTAVLEDLQAEVERLATLADDLLLLARLDSRALSDGWEYVDLAEVTGATGPPVPVFGDGAALRRMARNLIDNASRHGSTVRVSTAVEGDRAVLRVDDDGPGIPTADRERVFERWVRLDDGRSRSDGGAGLGLSLVREIARAHGGTVQVLDSPLGGARLRVDLPAGTTGVGPTGGRQ